MIKEINGPTKENCRTAGSGPATSLCLMMEVCGIGDNVHAAPVIWNAVQNGFTITIYCRPFHKSFFEALGARVFTIGRNHSGPVCIETGEDIGLLFLHAHDHEFGAFYSLNEWGVWKENELGYSPQDRMQWFAEILGLPLPASFSWSEVLGARKGVSTGVVFAPESTEGWRSLPPATARLVYDYLTSEFGEITWLYSWPDHSPDKALKTKCDSLESLIALVYNANVVIATESGVLNLATALGVPTVGMYGMTSPAHIINQFEVFLPVVTESVFGAQPYDESGAARCAMPCYRNAGNGFKGKCCGDLDLPYCLEYIDPVSIVQSTARVLNHKSVQQLIGE
jgi:hypothetical protein